jgi:hypothetical protein
MSTTVAAAPVMDVSVSSLVRRPVADVARHAADPATAESWLPHVLGRRLPLGFELVSFEPAVGMVLRSAQGPVALEATYTWEPTGSWTRLTLRQTGDAPIVGLAAPLIEKAASKAMSRTLARLVELLEVSRAA